MTRFTFSTKKGYEDLRLKVLKVRVARTFSDIITVFPDAILLKEEPLKDTENTENTEK